MNRVSRNGLSNTPEWRAWWDARRRCTVTTAKHYADYGGRGITVCERWESFEAFLADMGSRPDGHSLERRDNSLGYSPENCYWATPKEQLRNTRKNKYLTWNGKTQCLSAWAEEVGLERHTLKSRINSGWTLDRALTTPSLQPWKKGRVGNSGQA